MLIFVINSNHTYGKQILLNFKDKTKDIVIKNQNIFQLILSFLIGATIGFISWGNDYRLTIFSILIFYAFLILKNKKYLSLVVLLLPQ